MAPPSRGPVAVLPRRRARVSPRARSALPAGRRRRDGRACRSTTRKPEWLRPKVHHGPEVLALKRTVRELGLVTVCEDAGCPNLSECWADGTATFMVLGERCTRACGFCLVDTRHPEAPAADEPERVAEAIDRMGLDHAVLTMVARDDLADGGHGPRRRLRRGRSATAGPDTRVETLISDAHGSDDALARAVRRATRRAQPQRRDRRPAAAGRAPVGRLRPQPGRAGPGQGGRADDEVRADRRARRDRRRGRRLPRRPRRDRRRHRHDRPVPAPDVAPPAGRAVGRAGPVRRRGRPPARSSASATSRPARSPAPATTPGPPPTTSPRPPPPSRSGSELAVTRDPTLLRIRWWHTGGDDSSVYLDRLDRVRKAMAEQGVDVLLLSLGHDLPYLTGYHAMPLERLTMLVVPRDGDATLLVPRLEAPRVVEQPGVFALRPWDETEDPTAHRRRAGRAGATTVAVGDQMWARFLVELLPRLPGADVPPRRRRRRPAADGEGRRRDRRAAGRRRRRRPGRPAAPRRRDRRSSGAPRPQVSADISARLLAEGHDKVNFAIVAAGANAASPHHDAGDRVIAADEIVLCDFGGTMDGYCSDITRCVFTGRRRRPRSPRRTPCSTRPSRRAWPRPRSGRRARRSTASAGGSSPTPATATTSSTASATASGMEAHEDPYMVEGNDRPLAGRARLQRRARDLRGRVAGGCGWRTSSSPRADGPEPLNTADHALVPV